MSIFVTAKDSIDALCVDTDETFFVVAGPEFVSRYLLPSLDETHSVSIDGQASSAVLSSDTRFLFLSLWNSQGTETRILKRLATDLSPVSTLVGHPKNVLCLAFNAIENFLASGSRDGSIIIWQPENDRQLVRLSGHENSVLCIAISPTCEFFLSGGADKRVVRWDRSSRFPRSSIYCEEKAFSLLISKDEKSAFVGGQTSVVEVDLEGSQILRSFPKIHSNYVRSLVFLPDLSDIVTCSRDGFVRFLYSSSEPLKLHSGPVNGIHALRNGKLLSGGGNEQIVLTPLILRKPQTKSSAQCSVFEKRRVSFERIKNLYERFGPFDEIFGSLKLWTPHGRVSFAGRKKITRGFFDSGEITGRFYEITPTHILKLAKSANEDEYRAEVFLVRERMSLFGTLPLEWSNAREELKVSHIKR